MLFNVWCDWPLLRNWWHVYCLTCASFKSPNLFVQSGAFTEQPYFCMVAFLKRKKRRILHVDVAFTSSLWIYFLFFSQYVTISSCGDLRFPNVDRFPILHKFYSMNFPSHPLVSTEAIIDRLFVILQAYWLERWQWNSAVLLLSNVRRPAILLSLNSNWRSLLFCICFSDAAVSVPWTDWAKVTLCVKTVHVHVRLSFVDLLPFVANK